MSKKVIEIKAIPILRQVNGMPQYCCSNCYKVLFTKDNYCGKCGVKLAWRKEK